jgi:tRNA-2-methylthio-N6-dimethylallyladenosine synthase
MRSPSILAGFLLHFAALSGPLAGQTAPPGAVTSEDLLDEAQPTAAAPSDPRTEGERAAEQAFMDGDLSRALGLYRELAARTDNNRVVNLAGEESRIGTYADVLITAALPHSLRGEFVAT